MSKVYEVGIDLGELGTQTIATFDDMALAMAFLDGYKLADATSNVFIDTATSDFLESVLKDTELNGMLEALQYAMYKLETLYNNEERRNRIEQTLQQLTKIETLLIEHLP